MRVLRYTNLHPAGHFEMPTEGTIVDLLFAMPYLIGFGYRFPTYDELNGLLASGEWDTGMGGGTEWEPFTLTADEYAEVVAHIVLDARLTHLNDPLHGAPWAMGKWRGQ